MSVCAERREGGSSCWLLLIFAGFADERKLRSMIGFSGQVIERYPEERRYRVSDPRTITYRSAVQHLQQQRFRVRAPEAALSSLAVEQRQR